MMQILKPLFRGPVVSKKGGFFLCREGRNRHAHTAVANTSPANQSVMIVLYRRSQEILFFLLLSRQSINQAMEECDIRQALVLSG